ncbi:MAG TPA: hypothetical protein VFH78_07035 [Candidatus Thermoplasmatota archaeon]|nr:hypothetical protein [Candidatus Thermoplasmatota archaeon]
MFAILLLVGALVHVRRARRRRRAFIQAALRAQTLGPAWGHG